MNARFFKPTKIVWTVFVIFILIMVFGASQRGAFLDEANERPPNSFYTSLPDFIRELPLWEFWVYTIFPIVIMLGGNIWFYGGNIESGLFGREVFFISVNIVYYYIISSSVSYVITNRKHDGWKKNKRNNKILLITSIAYHVFLLVIGVLGFYFVPQNVGYAPSPQESFFFTLTILGSMSTMVFFIVIGMIYWINNQKPKKIITTIPFILFFVILFSLLIGVLPRGANA